MRERGAVLRPAPLNVITLTRERVRSGANVVNHRDIPDSGQHTSNISHESSAAIPNHIGQMANINGVGLFYKVHGRGHPVLLLHGGIGSTEDWNDITPFLVAAGFQVVEMDCRGRGRSAFGDAAITYEQMAADTLGLLDLLGIGRIDLVGWSDGAVIGIELAIRHPERLRKVVAYGANFSPDGVHDPTPSPSLETHFNRLAGDYRRLSPTPERLGEIFESLATLYKVAPNFSRDQLQSIRTPFLLLFGEDEEFIYAEHSLQLAELMPTATLLFMPNTGHFAVFEQPENFRRIVLNYLKD